MFDLHLEERSMNNNMVSKIRVGVSTSNIHLLISKFKVTCINGNFECHYVRTHSEEKTSKISSITFVIFLFSHKNTKTNCHPEYFVHRYRYSLIDLFDFRPKK